MVLGTGQMGSGIARLVLEKQGLELVGAYGRRRERAGMDVGRAIGIARDLGVAIGSDLDGLIETCRPQVAIQATCSRLAEAKNEILTLIRRGVHVISIAEEMAYPVHRFPETADEIHRQAVSQWVGVVGTGINPGFVLDLLVIALSGVCAEIGTITATRVNDLSPYGPTVLKNQGVGLTPEAFCEGLEDGTVVGHVGFAESIDMIASTLGWDIERIRETREPIISKVRRETPFVAVEPGQVAGCLHKAFAYRAGKPVISLVHPQQIQPQLEDVEPEDSIEIVGKPTLHLKASPEIPGDVGTIALAVNMIPRIMNAAPGLHNMADLPVPCAMLGDARRQVANAPEERNHG